jgi:NAD-dependent dihydropyrimidine dehydrogenase PreA subunit
MTPLHSLTTEQLQREARYHATEAKVRRAELRRREKAERPAKVKVRKVRSAEERAVEREYKALAVNEDNCWACGRDRYDKPDYWNAPFTLERAHIVNKTRVEDCRACVVLCSLCHRISHGDTFSYCELPPLTKAHLLWLKEQHGGCDWEFLAKHRVGALPEMEPLPVEYLESQRTFNPGEHE